MKRTRSVLLAVLMSSALALFVGCSSQQVTNAPDAAATTSQTQPGASASPAQAADASSQSQPAAEDSGGSSIASDVWEVVTFPFRVVADVVGFIL